MAGFSIPLDQLAAKMQADLETVVRKATFDLFAEVIRKTPVDTGRAKGNWIVSQGTPSTATLERDDKTPRGTYGSNMAAELLKLDTVPVGGVTFISNSLPYIRRLEYDGWSQQAPQGMVRLTAIEYSAYVQKAIGEL